MTPAGLYLHSPFCLHKCSYCDFNSWAESRREPQEQWLKALAKQIEFWSQHLSSREIVFETVFFGGGTPSLLDNDLLIRTGELLRKHFIFADHCEWTAECNPETLTLEKLEALKQMGANRLSLGIQSFQNKFLDALERRARAKDNFQALELVSKNWPGRWSLDLMYGLPEQTIQEWKADLYEALHFNANHISAYQLTLTTTRAKAWRQPDEEDLLKFTDATELILQADGLKRYEISNFAQPEHQSQHNLKYWRLEPFLGLGPGAAGLLSGHFLNNDFDRFGAHQKQPDHFEKWQSQAGSAAFEMASLQKRSAKDHFQELLMMGLRLDEGIAKSRFGELPTRVLQKGQELGFIKEHPSRWVASERAFRILDSVLSSLFKLFDEYSTGPVDSVQIDPKFQ